MALPPVSRMRRLMHPNWLSKNETLKLYKLIKKIKKLFTYSIKKKKGNYLGAVIDDKLTPINPAKQVTTPKYNGILFNLKIEQIYDYIILKF